MKDVHNPAIVPTRDRAIKQEVQSRCEWAAAVHSRKVTPEFRQKRERAYRDAHLEAAIARALAEAPALSAEQLETISAILSEAAADTAATSVSAVA